MIVGRKVQTLFARDGKQLQISLRSQRMSNTEFGRAIGRRPRISSGSGLAGVCARFLHPHWQHNKLLLSAASDYDQDIYHRGFSWRWSQRPKPRPDKICSPLFRRQTRPPSRSIPGFWPLIRHVLRLENRGRCAWQSLFVERANTHEGVEQGLAGPHPK